VGSLLCRRTGECDLVSSGLLWIGLGCVNRSVRPGGCWRWDWPAAFDPLSLLGRLWGGGGRRQRGHDRPFALPIAVLFPAAAWPGPALTGFLQQEVPPPLVGPCRWLPDTPRCRLALSLLRPCPDAGGPGCGPYTRVGTSAHDHRVALAPCAVASPAVSLGPDPAVGGAVIGLAGDFPSMGSSDLAPGSSGSGPSGAMGFQACC